MATITATRHGEATEKSQLVEMNWDPITRIVGSLGIFTKIDFGKRKVAECHGSSSIFRGCSIFKLCPMAACSESTFANPLTGQGTCVARSSPSSTQEKAFGPKTCASFSSRSSAPNRPKAQAWGCGSARASFVSTTAALPAELIAAILDASPVSACFSPAPQPSIKAQWRATRREGWNTRWPPAVTTRFCRPSVLSL